jgi:hypothetical protein
MEFLEHGIAYVFPQQKLSGVRQSAWPRRGAYLTDLLCLFSLLYFSINNAALSFSYYYYINSNL